MTYRPVLLIDQSEDRRKIHDEAERLRDEIWDYLFTAVHGEMCATVNTWNIRWPRHRFRMALMHGYLHTFVDPPIMGESRPDRIGSMWRRGAIVDLIEEIEAFDDYLCNIDTLMGSSIDGLDTSKDAP